jgi:hypothetical protein
MSWGWGKWGIYHLTPGRDLALKNWDIYQLKWGIYPAIRGDTDHFFLYLMVKMH